MSLNYKRERGQALVLIVFSIIGLLAMVGLAVDGGHSFMDRRQAQNAADTAALAGALKRIELIGDGEKNNSAIAAAVITTAKDIAAVNGYSHDIVHNTVDVYNPPISGPYSDCTTYDCNRYVQVIITSNVDTYFAKIVGVDEMENQVEAVALSKEPYRGPAFNGGALVSLDPGDEDKPPGEFILGGSGVVTVEGGGIFVNSANPTYAFNQDGNKTTISGPSLSMTSITAVGGINIIAPENIHAYLDPHRLDLQLKIPEDIPVYAPPDTCNATGYPLPKNGTEVVNGKTIKTKTFYPGLYNQLPPNENVDKIILAPGNYCVSKVLKGTKALFMEGHNVSIYIREGGDFSIQGGQIILDAPDEGDYENLLIYVAPTAYFTEQPTNCTITGNNSTPSQYTGTILAPHCNVTVAGDSGPYGYHAQFIGWTMKLTGTNSLYFDYKPGDNIQDYKPPEIGLLR